MQSFQKQFISLFNLIHPSRVHTYFHHSDDDPNVLNLHVNDEDVMIGKVFRTVTGTLFGCFRSLTRIKCKLQVGMPDYTSIHFAGNDMFLNPKFFPCSGMSDNPLHFRLTLPRRLTKQPTTTRMTRSTTLPQCNQVQKVMTIPTAFESLISLVF